MWIAALLLALLAGAASAEPPSLGTPRASSGSSSTAPAPRCQSGGDHGGPYIYHPDTECCTTTASACASGTSGSTYKRWTRECVATADDNPFIIVGNDSTTSLGLSGTFVYQTGTCFANDISGGEYTGDNQITYNTEINRLAAVNGKPSPLLFVEIRNDLADAYDRGTSDADIGAFDTDWFLKTTRVWESSVNTDGGTGFIDFMEGLQGAYSGGVPQSNFSGCRYPTNRTANPPTAADVWDQTGGCATTEQFKTPYIVAGLTAESRQNAVYYIFFREGTSQRMFYPTHMATDITNPNYRAWLTRYVWLRMEREHADGFEMNHKLHHYWKSSTQTRLQPWFNTGDALGGHDRRDCDRGSDTTAVTSLADIITYGCPGRSGPPFIRASDSDYAVDTEFTYPMYVDGLQEFGHLAYTNVPRLPYLIHVDPYWYESCTAGTTFTAANGYDDASCANDFDDPATAGVNEAALIRQWVQEAGYVVIDSADGTANDVGERAPTNCSPLPCDGGIGSGSGSGLSSAQLKAMIEASTPAPIRVIVYDTGINRSYPAKLGKDVWQTNPEPQLTVDLPAECANGVDDDADGLTDYPDDTGCDAATGDDETAPTVPECGDSIDNDSDSLTDYPSDTGCQSAADPRERGQCQDGFDNDGDGTTDYPGDASCTSETDDNEF